MSAPFGHMPVAPLLRALRDHLSAGTRLELVTPIGAVVETFLIDHVTPERRPGWFGRLEGTRWNVVHDGPAGPLSALATLAERAVLQRVAVWFTVRAPTGDTLLEAEDGNATLFLADTLPMAASAAVLDAVGARSPGVETHALG
jgi:hypothetical protein